MAEFGEQLRKAREAKGMTQQTLAENLYVTRQAVSRWECGDRFPDLITAKKISQILEVSIDDLISDKEIKNVAERNPVIEKPIINHIAITLFAFVVLTYAVNVVNTLIQLPLRTSSLGASDVWFIGVNLACEMVQVIIFVCGLIWIVKGQLSPKKTGFIMSVYFITICTYQLAGHFNGEHIVPVLALAVISAAGAIAAYLYFCQARNEKIWMGLIVAVSIWGIARMMISTGIMMIYAAQYMSMTTALGILLKLCVYLLFIYQVYVMNRKRCMVPDEIY